MTKKNLINNVRLREGLTWGQATRIVNEMFEDISDAVAGGDNVYIPKFGRFFTTEIETKRCKHPKTGEYVTKPRHEIVRFRMSEEFRRKLSGN